MRFFPIPYPIFVWVFSLLLAGCRQAPRDEGALIVATAANMRYAMPALLEAYTQETGKPCRMVTGASGQLTAQIRQGAPFDVLVSADRRYPEDLVQAGLTQGAPVVYARGQLLFWAARSNVAPPDIGAMMDDPDAMLALPNPEFAPYGTAAKAFLEDKEMWGELQGRLIFGQSVSQVDQFLTTGAVAYAITSSALLSTVPHGNCRVIGRSFLLICIPYRTSRGGVKPQG